jgi:hypothetical protein
MKIVKIEKIGMKKSDVDFDPLKEHILEVTKIRGWIRVKCWLENFIRKIDGEEGVIKNDK